MRKRKRNASGGTTYVDELSFIEEKRMTENFTVSTRSTECSGGRQRINSSVIKLATKISDAESSKEAEERTKRNEMRKQLFQSCTTLFMQDGPFLILRFYVISKFNIKSEMHLYFTCKNLIVILLQCYRLLTIYKSRTNHQRIWDREETLKMLRKIQLATMAAMNIPEVVSSTEDEEENENDAMVTSFV